MRYGSQFLELARKLKLRSVELIPVSALVGDNIVDPSSINDLVQRPTLLEYLETVPLQTIDHDLRAVALSRATGAAP